MSKVGVMTWLQDDNLGSASLATDVNGGVIANVRYKPFGETRVETGAMPTNRRFDGMIEESQAGGLYDFGARMYLPKVGRFISADSIVPNPKDPQSLNRYSFVRNNPLGFTDPSGHAQIAPEGSGCGASDLRTCFISQYQGFGWGTGGINYAEGTLFQLIYERYQIVKPEGWEIKSEGLPETIAQAYQQGDFNMPAAKRPVDWGDTVWTIMAQSGGLHMAGAVINGTKPGGGVDVRLAQTSVGNIFGLTSVEKGKAGVIIAAEEISSEGGIILGRGEVTFETPSGRRTRLDIVYSDSNGEMRCCEVKNGPSARLSVNQSLAHEEMRSVGATPRGQNAVLAGLNPNEFLGPIPVEVRYYGR